MRKLIIDHHSINFDKDKGDALDRKGITSCAACDRERCGVNGRCVPTGDTAFVCQCYPEFSGKVCEIKGEFFCSGGYLGLECSEDRCQHGQCYI